MEVGDGGGWWVGCTREHSPTHTSTSAPRSPSTLRVVPRVNESSESIAVGHLAARYPPQATRRTLITWRHWLRHHPLRHLEAHRIPHRPRSNTIIAVDATAAAANPQFTVISDEDQALLDSFFAGQDTADDYSDLFGSGMASQTYGLAPQVVSGDIERLPLPGVGQPGYSNEAVSSYGAVSLSCSLGYLEEPFRSRFVALSPAMMNAGFSCGRCVRLQCDDTSCAEAGKQIVAQVVDRGGELFDGDVTLSGALFKELTGRDFGRNPSIHVSWAFESCSPWIDTPVKMLVKPGMYWALAAPSWA